MLYRLVPQVEVIVCRFAEEDHHKACDKRDCFEQAKSTAANYVGSFAKEENLGHLSLCTKQFVRERDSYQAVVQELATVIGVTLVMHA
jgi:hypothetical protein